MALIFTSNVKVKWRPLCYKFCSKKSKENMYLYHTQEKKMSAPKQSEKYFFECKKLREYFFVSPVSNERLPTMKKDPFSIGKEFFWSKNAAFLRQFGVKSRHFATILHKLVCIACRQNLRNLFTDFEVHSSYCKLYI